MGLRHLSATLLLLHSAIVDTPHALLVDTPHYEKSKSNDSINSDFKHSVNSLLVLPNPVFFTNQIRNRLRNGKTGCNICAIRDANCWIWHLSGTGY